MPDTPSSFEFESGRNVENVDMAQTGETNLPGLLHLFNEQMEFLLPAQSGRSYAPQEWTGETYPTVEKLVAWSNAGTVLRLIVTGTSANYPVLLGPVIYGEDDGTNDVKVKLTFYRYRYIGHETTVKTSTGNTGRTSGSSGTQTTTYTVKHGDTLWGICPANTTVRAACTRNWPGTITLKTPTSFTAGRKSSCRPHPNWGKNGF